MNARPPFISVPLAQGLRWRGGAGWRFEEKLDGVWSVRTIGLASVAGEQMRDGRFIAFDILNLDGQDLCPLPLRQRLEALDGLNLSRPACGHGGEFLEAVLARGGEGVVAKLLDAPYGEPWHKCKRIETFDLIVTAKAADRHSIQLATVQGEPRGWCPCWRDYDAVRVGDMVEIAAYGLTMQGKLREPRFIRLRADKTGVA